MRRTLLSALGSALAAGLATLALAADPDPRNWEAVKAEARGQTVYFHAWGGEPRINAFFEWAGRETEARYGVSLVQVKLADTADAVARVVAEKAAGNLDRGAVDLIWINGENFASMKAAGLLFGPWAEAMPNFALTDPSHNPGVREDFTVPTEGYEAPLGAARLVFLYDSARTPEPPTTLAALADWAKANPGRFAYPLPPDYLGSTFLKQALLGLAADRAALYRPLDEARFAEVTAPLWSYLDALHPHLWRRAEAYPANGPAMRRLLADGETDIAFAFDPADASAAIASGELPDTARTFVLEGGTVGNVNFLAIPFNAAHKAGAMVVANFLLSPEAQARKLDPAVWGQATVLAPAMLSAEDRARFDSVDLGPATLDAAALGPMTPEPHPSWMERLEAEWATRYGAR